VFEPIKGGPTDGIKINRADFQLAKEEYYKLAGWDNKGIPTRTKLNELDLEWVADMLDLNNSTIC
jgi:aldehyde:ferredoxin oxidoreductase